ncbi:MAG: PAS domain S-box protein, partial [Bacteroidetes bacterium]|nr:PAS domain S-box protein [Bacteroidota bacterium]
MFLVENTQHRLLKRQLKKHLPIEMAESIELRAFVEAIDQAYQEFDTDIKRTENILEQSSRELFRANQELKQYADDKAKEAKAIADRLQVVADSISDVIFQLDLNGNFTYLNSAWTLITAHNIQTSIGKCILEYIHPDSYTDFKLELEGLLKNHDEIRSYTTKILTKTGELRYIKINIKLNDNLTENSEGASGSITDVTEGHLAQKEKERLAMLVRKSNNIILVADAKGRIEWANHAFTRITGYDLDEVKGKKPGDVLQGKNTNPETVKYISDQLKKQQSVNCEIINYSKSGREYWLEISIDPIYDE